MRQETYQTSTIENILSQRQFEAISATMSRLAEKLRVSAVLLVNSSGRIVARNVKSGWSGNVTLLATLAASSYAAANEMAKILGEKDNFQMMLHEGKAYNMFVCTVSPNYFLSVVFEKGIALGMVRLFTKKTIEQLIPLLKPVKNESDNLQHVINEQFEDLLGDELDKAFIEV